jgi:hypothetical protein
MHKPALAMNAKTFTDKQVIEQRDSLEMMRRPYLWPLTSLPLKHETQQAPSGLPRTAILVHTQEYIFIPDALIWLPPTNLDNPAYRRGEDPLLIEILKEGWIVD